MIHKPKWKARARGYKFFPVEIFKHPVPVIIFSNIYTNIIARIIGLTNQIKGEYEWIAINREFDKTVRMYINNHLSVQQSKQEVFVNDVLVLLHVLVSYPSMWKTRTSNY